MANTYSLLASTILTGSQASVTFSSIPQNYTDLVLKVSARTTQAAVVTSISTSFNGDTNTATNYSWTQLLGDAATATSTRQSSIYWTLTRAPGSSATANTFANNEIYIPNYTSTISKPISSMSATENNATTAYMTAAANLYQNTTAITSISLTSQSGSFDTGSSFYLYGISKS